MPCRHSFLTPELSVGSHTFRVSSSILGAEGPTALRRFVVDPAAPGTLIDGGPEGPTNDPTPTFTFEAPAGGTSFFCSLDGSAESPCESPITLAPLVVATYFGSLVLKMNPVILCGALAGAQTNAAVLNAVNEAADSNLPTLGFTLPFAVNNMILTIAASVIVGVV